MRKICVITGNRAEYGLLRWLMADIRDDADLDLQVIATGAHLLTHFGETVKDIEADGFAIDARVDMLLASDAPASVARSVGLGVLGMTDALERLAPDIVVVLGDRFETLAAAQAALFLHIPLAHIHGGERTEGVVDEAIRHAITKMSHLHFVAADEYRNRVIQMGEEPERVFTVGAMAADAIARLDLMDKPALERDLDIDLGERYFMVTYHPAAMTGRDPAEPARALIEALNRFPNHKAIVTGANPDAGNRPVVEAFEAWAARAPDRVLMRASLGQLRYLSAVKGADAVVGNSSSGVIEAPALGTPTVDIGDRQRGRLKAASVVGCGDDADAITDAIEKALSDDMARTLAAMTPVYGQGDAAKQVLARLKSAALDGILVKTFHDLD